jgi:hypothetical protein
MPSTVEPHIVYYLAGIINRLGNLKDHETVEYTKIPNTPEFTTIVAAETFRDDVILANDENRKFYRCAPAGGAFSPNHIKVITQNRTVILE